MNELEKKRKERAEGLELVMFPASKNYPLEQDLDDPLEELLSEFAEYEEELVLDVEDFSELDELNLNLQERLKGHDKREVLLQQMLLLEETQQRIKVYLDEIDSVLPTR